MDLNLRTTASDGVWSLAQTFEYARAFDLRLFSITDRDVPQEIAVPSDLSDRYVPGVKVYAQIENRKVNLLVYGSLGLDSKLAVELAHQRRRRNKCIFDILVKLASRDIVITLDDVLVETGPGCVSVGRLHVARTLVRLGKVRSVDGAFQKYLAQGRPCYVPLSRISVKEVIEMAHAARAVVIAANPLPLGNLADIERLQKLGIDGIETRHRSLNGDQSIRLEQYARNRALLISGGSGSGNSEARVPVRFARDLIEDFRRCLFARVR